MAQTADRSNGYPRGTDRPNTARFPNTILKALDGSITERLRLRPVTFELGHEIEFPGSPIDHL